MDNQSRPGRAVIRAASNGQFYVRNEAVGNLEVLSTSETLTSLQTAINNILAHARLYSGTPPDIIMPTEDEIIAARLIRRDIAIDEANAEAKDRG
jgi:hypothetical protein